MARNGMTEEEARRAVSSFYEPRVADGRALIFASEEARDTRDVESELAEQDAEEEIEDKCKGFVEILETLQEEHEQQIEALKKRAVEAFGSLDFTEFMTAECVQDFDNVKCKLRGLFIQKLNER